MEVWLLLFASLCLCALVQYVVNIFLARKLPPSPPTIPFFGNLLWLLKSSKDFAQIEPILHHMRMKYGPIVTLYIGSRPAIFLTTHAPAHQALVQSGSIFASRPNLETTNVLLNNQCTLTSAPYGLLWRLLRQNFMSTLHPCKLHLYSDGRVWALNIFRAKLLSYLQNIVSSNSISLDSGCDMVSKDEPDMDNSKSEKKANKGVPVLEQFRYAFFCLMVYILFGEKFEEDVIKGIEEAQQTLLTNFIRFNVLNFMPRLGKIVFRKIWKDLLKIQQSQQNIFLPLIKARREKMNKIVKDENVDNCFYVDSLLHLQLPQEYGSRKLLDDEIVCFCSEFLTAGTDTSIATFQWVMANLVKYQDIQEKLYEEITSVVRKGEDVSESDLQNMIFLRSIILETLRCHPPAHFMIPHAVTEDTKLGGYHIPKNAMVNVTLAELGRDPNVWDNPLEFKPERFLDNNGKIDFDLKGVKEIKMIPFGAGIRSCPAITMALLHLQFFVANMVREFKWVPIEGEEIDLTEKQDFSIVMKNPLRAQILPRIN